MTIKENAMARDTLQEIMGMLIRILAVRDDEIEEDTAFSKDYDIGVLDVAKLVIACERRFRITIHDEDVHTFRCANDVAAYVDALLEDGSDDLALHDDDERTSWYYE
ncbi:MAG: phosphopantetheine-binding protein [Peptococcaceae bacterium]|jgi:acyl carrier protein|nr:phosphopantetheine-binding protein [Peptococcaceae bacterium]